MDHYSKTVQISKDLLADEAIRKLYFGFSDQPYEIRFDKPNPNSFMYDVFLANNTSLPSLDNYSLVEQIQSKKDLESAIIKLIQNPPQSIRIIREQENIFKLYQSKAS